MATKVSLLFFSHNQEPFLRQALDGAFQQKYPNLEILITDDGSVDDSFHLLAKMADGYRGPHSVVVRRNPSPLGLAESINRAMDVATGDFFVIAAGDDVSDPRRCESMVEVWERFGRQLHLVHSAYRRVDATGAALAATGHERNLQTLSQPTVQRVSPGLQIRTFAPYVVGCTAGWDRALFEHFGPLRSRVVQEDVVLAFRGTLSGGILLIPDQLVDYRLHASNIYHSDFRLVESGVTRSRREFDLLEAFKLRNLRFKSAIHDNFEADILKAAELGLLEESAVASLSGLVIYERKRAQAEIALRSGGVGRRALALLALRHLGEKPQVGDLARLLPTPLYRTFRILLHSRTKTVP